MSDEKPYEYLDGKPAFRNSIAHFRAWKETPIFAELVENIWES